ncbi:AraC family transcriptional regulator [Ruegeria sp. R14_0]|uniref:AraC family transcriptional regulator n=1 Tax=Ruegeria sp. R14_0 TaxID=2821100 RepID=UPI001ADABA06|nr:AraC family transcriptional regulator [Ruegeria sp. R14_0]MBO9446869.1 AraC family transcriptional regulator ligand-binding domain-containing protein [Ruegeria sp. R14_0]
MTVSIPAVFAENLLQGVTRRGADPAAILKRAGLSAANRSMTHPSFVKLVRTVTLTLDDELGGLQDRPQRIGSTAILAAHASHAENLGEAYRRTVQFMDVLDNSFRYRFREEGESAIFEMERIPGRVVLNELAVEMIMVLVNRMLGWLAGNKGAVNRAWFDYASPSHAPIYRAMFLQAPVRFEQSTSGLAIPRALMKLPLVRTEDQAMAYARRTPLDAFLPMDGTTGLALEAALAIDTILTRDGRLADMEEIGRLLNMPSHRLRRTLKREGVDYSDLRKQVRRDLAVRLLTTTDLPIEVVASRCGFSEASAFIRAFRGWTGLTPRTYRVSDL